MRKLLRALRRRRPAVITINISGDVRDKSELAAQIVRELKKKRRGNGDLGLS